MSPTRSRIVWKSLFAGVCLLLSSLASATAFAAEPDVIRVQAENDAYFNIGRIKLINLTTSETDINRQNYRGRDGLTKSTKIKASNKAKTTQSFEFQFDPVGGVGGDSGSRVCA